MDNLMLFAACTAALILFISRAPLVSEDYDPPSYLNEPNEETQGGTAS